MYKPASEVFKTLEPRDCVGCKARLLHPQWIGVKEAVITGGWREDGDHVVCVLRTIDKGVPFQCEAGWLEISIND